ncbi:9314_t:CDS:1 [Dentiscutata heterogama]|uniref:9314_t:CDS:1 n=1 Tax=Dentiscutata heterogama TaxID=1316150 RepID=A0ACA9LF02_9GLOM|nr:9314_t:CDS:1 [Dentiscutata heterogama]
MPYNNYQLNDLQRKALTDLFAHLQHFNQEFSKCNFLKNEDSLYLRNIKTTAINLSFYYVHQKNVVIGDEIFRKAVKDHKDWYEVNKQWIIFFVYLAKSSVEKYSSHACVPSVEETKKGDDWKKNAFSDSVGKGQSFTSKKSKKILQKVSDDQFIKPPKKLDIDKKFVPIQKKKFMKKCSGNL